MLDQDELQRQTKLGNAYQVCRQQCIRIVHNQITLPGDSRPDARSRISGEGHDISRVLIDIIHQPTHMCFIMKLVNT